MPYSSLLKFHSGGVWLLVLFVSSNIFVIWLYVLASVSLYSVWWVLLELFRVTSCTDWGFRFFFKVEWHFEGLLCSRYCHVILYCGSGTLFPAFVDNSPRHIKCHWASLWNTYQRCINWMCNKHIMCVCVCVCVFLCQHLSAQKSLSKFQWHFMWELICFHIIHCTPCLT